MYTPLISVTALLVTVLVSPPMANAEAVLEPFVNSNCRFAGTFSQQTRIPGLSRDLVSTGQFVFDCQAGVIWNTLQPAMETQIFTFAGKHYQVNSDSSVELLEGRYQSYLGQLMLTLIEGNEERIKSDFYLLTGAEDELVLKPKNRRLKRVLDHVKLYRRPETNDGQPVVIVTVVDRNNQAMRVEPVTQVNYDSAQQMSAQCAAFVQPHGEKLCELLISNRRDEYPTP